MKSKITGSKLWVKRVQEAYSSLENLKDYNSIYLIATRCGYDSVEKLWNDNPIIQGSTNPRDFGLYKK